MSVKAINETHTRMTWVKALLVTVLIAIPAFILGPIIWPPAEGSPSPTTAQIPFLLFLIWCRPRSWGWGSPSSPSAYP